MGRGVAADPLDPAPELVLCRDGRALRVEHIEGRCRGGDVERKACLDERGATVGGAGGCSMTIKRYLFDHSRGGESVLTAVFGGERPRVRTRETWFHAQGGGQRGDRGKIGRAQVIDTRHGDEGEIDHFIENLDGLFVGMEVKLAVDAHHRYRGSLLHSGGHLVAEAGRLACPLLKAVAGHHWDGEARVEFVGSGVDEDFLGRLSSAVADLVPQDLQIETIGDSCTSRAIRIGAFDPIPCGGTHLRGTSELASLVVTRTTTKKDRVRVSYSL